VLFFDFWKLNHAWNASVAFGATGAARGVD